MADFVVVVGAVVLVVVDVDGVVGVVLVEFVVADVFVVADDDERAAAFVALVPGSSFATTTPTRAMDATAAITVDCVMRRRRTWAR